MKKLKYILLSLCIMSSPILASNKVSMISPKTYEAYSTTGLIGNWTYSNVDFENAKDYYVWEIKGYEYIYQADTGTYHYSNCVPTTFINLSNILGIEHTETVEEIKVIMKNSKSESMLKKGTTIDESIRYLTNKKIPYETLYIPVDKQKMKELIKENLIVTNVALQYVDDEFEKEAKEKGDMNSYNYNHCVLIVGYQEIDNKLQLLILDTNSVRLSVWDYDRWKIAYEKFSNVSYDNRLLMIKTEKLEYDEIVELTETKTKEFEIKQQLMIERELKLQEEIENYIYPIF